MTEVLFKYTLIFGLKNLCGPPYRMLLFFNLKIQHVQSLGHLTHHTLQTATLHITAKYDTLQTQTEQCDASDLI